MFHPPNFDQGTQSKDILIFLNNFLSTCCEAMNFNKKSRMRAKTDPA